MALVRVYCGLASAEATQQEPDGAWLTVAVVDDAGRLLDVNDLTDDPTGYAQLGALLAERSSGPTGVAIAADSDDHQVTMLLTAAGRPLAFADDDAVDDFAERFADDESIEEMESPAAVRRAVGLARALQAGALSAVALPAPREMAPLKPILAAHAAMATGRQAAAVALREVLRELFPAALRAYPDPADPVPLAILDAMPEPGVVGGSSASRGRDAAAAADAVATQLAAIGVADAPTVTEAVTALRVAIAETPRRGAVSKSLSTAVANTVREAVAAVRACDAAGAALIGALTERANPSTAVQRPRLVRPRPVAQAPVSAPGVTALRAVRESTAEYATVRVPAPRRTRPAGGPVSPAMPAAQLPLANRPVSPAAYRSVSPAAARPVSPAPPPPPGIMPIPPGGISAPRPSRPAPPTPVEPFLMTVTAADPFGAEHATAIASFAGPDRQAPPGARENWPLNPPLEDQLGDPAAALRYPSGGFDPSGDLTGSGGFDPRPGRVTPPWQADDLPPEPPMLRLVDPPPLADPALRDDPLGDLGGRLADLGGPRDLGGGLADRGSLADLSGPRDFGAPRDLGGPRDFGNDSFGNDGVRFDPPILRVVDGGGMDSNRGRRPAGVPPIAAVPPIGDEADSDLLIFSEISSAWFTDETTDTEVGWGHADAGWRAAEQAARPSVGASTEAGLPKRVPQANLVPGSPIAAPERPLRIVRDPESIAAHTSGYFRGWRRGQEIGGYSVGGRPGRESAQGWDFSRDQGEQQEYAYDDYYRQAAYQR